MKIFQPQKTKIYALFQFFSFLAIASLAISLIIISYINVINHNDSMLKSIDFWLNSILGCLRFEVSSQHGISASVFLYVFLALWFVSLLIGLQMTRIKTRNLFDTLFILFSIIPIFSSFLAVFGQLSSSKVEIVKAKVNEIEVKAQQTQILNKRYLNDLEHEKTRLLNILESTKNSIDQVATPGHVKKVETQLESTKSKIYSVDNEITFAKSAINQIEGIIGDSSGKSVIEKEIKEYIAEVTHNELKNSNRIAHKLANKITKASNQDSTTPKKRNIIKKKPIINTTNKKSSVIKKEPKTSSKPLSAPKKKNIIKKKITINATNKKSSVIKKQPKTSSKPLSASKKKTETTQKNI